MAQDSGKKSVCCMRFSADATKLKVPWMFVLVDIIGSADHAGSLYVLCNERL